MSEESTYLELLPAVYRGAFRGPKGEAADPAQLGLYLKIFERILTQPAEMESLEPRSLGEMLDALPDILYPGFYFLLREERDFVRPMSLEPGFDSLEKERFETYLRLDGAFEPWLDELLDWVAGWIGLVLHRNWATDKKREVIAKILPLYRRRGTRGGLEDLLHLYFDRKVKIIDESPRPGFRVGRSSRPGGRATVGGFPPYYFIAAVALKETDRPIVRDLLKSLNSVIESEKPAHTRFNLALRWPGDMTPRFRVGSARLKFNSTI